MNPSLRSAQSATDPSTLRALSLRREQWRTSTTEPDYPATGTDLISARLAQARAERNRSASLIDLTGSARADR